jgi:GNAT superfamily N-acetyltransferase
MTIRAYRPDDWDAVCAIYDRAKPDELRWAGIEASFIPLRVDPGRVEGFNRHTIFVAERDGCIVGFGGHQGDYIGWLYVDPAHYRTGIGRALLRHLIGRIRGTPWLWSIKGNRAAWALYRRAGFTLTEEQRTENAGRGCMVQKLVLQNLSPPAQR